MGKDATVGIFQDEAPYTDIEYFEMSSWICYLFDGPCSYWCAPFSVEDLFGTGMEYSSFTMI